MESDLDKRETKKIDGPILLFDLDNTLVTYDKRNRLDWSIFDYVKEWLSGYRGKITIISNQKNYSDVIKTKISDILIELRKSVIVDIYISTGDNWYRKPSPKIFSEKILEPNREYIYIGDAAGREDDFSNSDLLFAYNANVVAQTQNSTVKFRTPEEFFGLPTKSGLPKISDIFSPLKNKRDPNVEKKIMEETIKKIDLKKKNIVIMVGLPGSGKSFFVDYLISYLDTEISTIIVTKDRDDIHNFPIINVSTKLTRKKIAEISEYNLVIWDTTGYSADKRREIMETFGDYTPFIVWMQTTKKERKWLRFYRLIEKNISVPEIALRFQEKNFEEPTASEIKKGELVIIRTFNLVDPVSLGLEGKFLV